MRGEVNDAVHAGDGFLDGCRVGQVADAHLVGMLECVAIKATDEVTMSLELGTDGTADGPRGAGDQNPLSFHLAIPPIFTGLRLDGS